MKKIKIAFAIVSIFLILLFLIRLSTPREIDDINPQIPCEKKYIEKSDIIWVVPLLNGIPISENKTWCQEILALNKTIGLHGIYHTHHEFKYPVTEKNLNHAKKVFQECFGYQPEIFKPPYLKLSKQNKELLEKHNLEIKWIWNQNFHKVYHCQDSGIFPNKFHDIF
ncbi:MAG TPA: polysaccharide deacetylase family protein [Candidatus Nanoarchaeia archaeon]|nr:polysaccharide deacetylase family protein [Candidatus Nanoarchaeia archaeon]